MYANRYSLTWSQCRAKDRLALLPGILCILGFFLVELIERGI